MVIYCLILVSVSVKFHHMFVQMFKFGLGCRIATIRERAAARLTLCALCIIFIRNFSFPVFCFFCQDLDFDFPSA